MLVLEGNQGKRKSTALRELFSDEWFSDARLTMNDEGLKKLRGKWGMEIPELEGFRGKAASEIKAFITSRIDHYRESYGRHAKDFPRTCVFAGTTNEREYLIDRTGNRRFWPVLCGNIALDGLRDERDQIWAEALTRFQCKENWWLADETDAREEQRKREVREPWYELITPWLSDPTVPDGTHGARRRIDMEHGFTVAEVMQGALNLRAADMQREALTRVGFCLHKLGFVARRVQRNGARERRYFPADSIHGRSTF
jgi:putative DNA primase/helicase